MIKNIPFFANRLNHKLIDSLSSFFKTDEHQELLTKVDTHLLVWDNTLVNLKTGKHQTLDDLEASTIATAASQLIPESDRSKTTLHAALYLPPQDFVATEYELPAVAARDISSALNYQVDYLMPAYPGKLLLAVNHNELQQSNIALWLDELLSQTLFDSFKPFNIELTAIFPRIILAFLVNVKTPVRKFTEQDSNGLLEVVLDHHYLTQWRSINHSEMQDKEYFEQWQKETAPIEDRVMVDTYGFWQQIDRSHLEQLRYAFFPESARQNLKQRSRLKKDRLALIGAIVFSFLIAMPFLGNLMSKSHWQKQFQMRHTETLEVRTQRDAVTQFEDRWALYQDYPRADITAIIKKLNKIIPRDSWIKSFEIKNGVVTIDGYSPNPTKILEVISKQREFDQAAFNQRTRTERGKENERFGITFHLSSIDMKAYQEKYFPVN